MQVSYKTTLKYIIQRLHEKSTYAMLPIILSLYGIQSDPVAYNLICTLGISLSGLLLILLPESNAQRALTFTDYVVARLNEPTTFIAIPLLFGAVGIHIDNQIIHQIAIILVGIGGLLAAILSENGVSIPADTVTEVTAPVVEQQINTDTTASPVGSATTTPAS